MSLSTFTITVLIVTIILQCMSIPILTYLLYTLRSEFSKSDPPPSRRIRWLSTLCLLGGITFAFVQTGVSSIELHTNREFDGRDACYIENIGFSLCAVTYFSLTFFFFIRMHIVFKGSQYHLHWSLPWILLGILGCVGLVTVVVPLAINECGIASASLFVMSLQLRIIIAIGALLALQWTMTCLFVHRLYSLSNLRQTVTAQTREYQETLHSLCIKQLNLNLLMSVTSSILMISGGFSPIAIRSTVTIDTVINAGCIYMSFSCGDDLYWKIFGRLHNVCQGAKVTIERVTSSVESHRHR